MTDGLLATAQILLGFPFLGRFEPATHCYDEVQIMKLPTLVGTALTSVGAVLLPGLTVAQGGPPPVTVGGIVQVQGAVQTTNDVVYLPFNKSASDNIDSGDAARSLNADFDVPDGKRLVVESITFQAIGTADRLFIEMRQGDSTVFAPLSAQYMSADGYLTATLPFKARIDAVAGNTRELRIRFGNSAPPASLWAGVYGYLVDL